MGRTGMTTKLSLIDIKTLIDPAAPISGRQADKDRDNAR